MMNTLVESNNSIHANFNGDVLDLYIVKGENGNTEMFYTQLTSDEIKDMIASPAKKESLEQRLMHDFNSDYNFDSPSKRHLNEYPKSLMNSIKSHEFITYPGCKKNELHTRKLKPHSKQHHLTKNKKKKNKKNKKKKNGQTKRIIYTPYLTNTKRSKSRLKLTPRSNDRLLQLNKQRKKRKMKPIYSI